MKAIDSTVRLATGREMPVMGLGTWQLERDTSEVVAEALRSGYRMIDTSGDYGTEPGVGEGLRGSGINRADVFVVTKVEEDEDAYQSTREGLDAMGIDYADLMLVHRPPDDGAGEALWQGLRRARDEHLTRDIGVSNYTTEQIDALISDSGETPAVNQIEWSPFGWDRGMLDYANEHGIVIQAYSPLTRGERLDHEVLTGIAETHGKTPAQVVLRWQLQLGVVPLPKANAIDHLHENADIFDFELSDGEMARIGGLNEHYSALGSLPYV
ncbi:MAG TPA: aldo/keto reductase [Ilumatobacter sp.]|nr:aldo/keto reductase [Ilumatobacter sp.]